MPLRIERYEPYHFEIIKAQGLQSAQARALSLVSASYATLASAAGPAYTAWVGQDIVACGGMASA
jgi:hypothetical protein